MRGLEVDWSGIARDGFGKAKASVSGSATVRESREPMFYGWPKLVVAGFMVACGFWASPFIGAVVAACWIRNLWNDDWQSNRLERRLERKYGEKTAESPVSVPDASASSHYVISVYQGSSGPTVTVEGEHGTLSTQVFADWGEVGEYTDELEAHFRDEGTTYRYGKAPI